MRKIIFILLSFFALLYFVRLTVIAEAEESKNFESQIGIQFEGTFEEPDEPEVPDPGEVENSGDGNTGSSSTNETESTTSDTNSSTTGESTVPSSSKDTPNSSLPNTTGSGKPGILPQTGEKQNIFIVGLGIFIFAITCIVRKNYKEKGNN